jgi:hypothetical protein
MSYRVPTIEEITEAWGPTESWEGNCHGLATVVAELMGEPARVVRGHWLGDCAPHGYWGDRRHLPFQAHSWVQVGNDIIDPTRWSFVGEEPSVWVIKDPCGCIDFDEVDTFLCACDHVTEEHEDGNRWRAENLPPLPADEGNKVECDFGGAEDVVNHLLGRPGQVSGPKEYAVQQLAWLANLPPNSFEGNEREVYRVLTKVGLEALVPIDNYRTVMFA